MEIQNWSDGINDELVKLSKTRTSIKNVIVSLTVAGATDDLIAPLVPDINDLENILNLYGVRSFLLAGLFDRASKESTLVSENYEKMEECVETIRSELKDLIKKLYSFSTLEMDYYDKLLAAYDKDGDLRYRQDYDGYRNRLSMIHRRDQYNVFRLTIDGMLVGVMNLIHKLESIVGSKENMQEICKLWEKHNRMIY